MYALFLSALPFVHQYVDTGKSTFDIAKSQTYPELCTKLLICTSLFVKGNPDYASVAVADIDTYGAGEYREDVDFIHSDCVLAASYHPDTSGIQPTMFEWSVSDGGVKPGLRSCSISLT